MWPDGATSWADGGLWCSSEQNGKFHDAVVCRHLARLRSGAAGRCVVHHRMVSRSNSCCFPYRHLAGRTDELGPLADRTVDSLGWAKRKVRQRLVQQQRCAAAQVAWEQTSFHFIRAAPHRMRGTPSVPNAEHDTGSVNFRNGGQHVGQRHVIRHSVEMHWGAFLTSAFSMQVLSTAPEVSAFEAMVSMSASGISALAVVSESGRLIGNFSTSELRTIMADHFGSLVSQHTSLTWHICKVMNLMESAVFMPVSGSGRLAGSFSSSELRTMAEHHGRSIWLTDE